MGSKTISVQEDTYRKLKRHKREDESFTDLLERLIGNDPEGENPLWDLVGLTDEEGVERLRRTSAAFAEEFDEEMDDRLTSGSRDR